MIQDSRKLTEEDIATIKFCLEKAGMGKEAEELGGGTAAGSGHEAPKLRDAGVQTPSLRNRPAWGRACHSGGSR